MKLHISARVAIHASAPADLLLQLEVASLPDQRVISATTSLPRNHHCNRVASHDGLGERVWLHAEGDCTVEYRAMVAIERQVPPLETLAAVPPHRLCGDVTQYLFDSRYCQIDPMHGFVAEHFGTLQGGAKVQAMRDWIAEHFDYVPGASNAHTTALDSFVERRGICRDYAHVLVTFARAAAIPARFVSCYSPQVDPPDFHAVAQVWLADPQGDGGAWQIVDATGMADPAQTAIIGVGRDAADVSFLTSYGPAWFERAEVKVVPG
ncbi:MAG: transglutaminase family protein [Erythrobacter sp.]|nr:transglutaminase family protein [Erythrobacter sp.]